MTEKVSLIFLNLSFLLFLIATISGDSPLYNRVENLAVDCGSATGTRVKGTRSWIADTIPSKFFTVQHYPKSPQHNGVSANLFARQQPSSGGKVPYSTARISRDQFSYIFHVTPGPKFLRLHFYPTSYPSNSGEFGPNEAFFSVTANRFTLLRNFSAVAAAAREKSEVLNKEFCVNVDDRDRRMINVTFTPASSANNAAYYAFINGIELVSMPENLYLGIRKPQDSIKLLGVESDGSYQLAYDKALENTHRLQIGGAPIRAEVDTGMYRSWAQDVGYVLLGAQLGVEPVNWTFEPNFARIPPYSAPAELYKSSRSMGPNKTNNLAYNLTWELPVDRGFFYFIRLHFCEVLSNVTEENDRQFRIYINEQVAEEQADVIVWSGGNQVPVYRDYVVRMQQEERPGGRDVRSNVSVALHAKGDLWTLYSDAVLNGLELFKVSDASNNLAVPDPTPPASPTQDPSQLSNPPRSGDNNKKKKVILAAAIAVVASIFASLIIVAMGRRRAAYQYHKTAEKKGSYSLNSSASRLPSELCHHFSLSEVQAATNDFDDALVIGRGGFGDVYKGCITVSSDGDALPVAVKRLKSGSRQGAREFKTEIEMLSQLRHVHLVSLIGYSDDAGEMILVYEYVSRGSLRDHLYSCPGSAAGCDDVVPLKWTRRLRICLGAARGLHYLHAGAAEQSTAIIHRDVKTTNILLDEEWSAKVSDFGLSKVGPSGLTDAHVSTVVKGSFGYLDPEYFRRQKLTEKSDVYSFGVVLLEVLCARPPLIQALPKDQVSLAEWGRICYDRGTLDQIVDPVLLMDGGVSKECLRVYGDLAMSCLREEGIRRPSMGDVVGSLEFALLLQESAEQEIVKGKMDDDVAFSDWAMTSSTGGEESSTTATRTETGEESETEALMSGATAAAVVFSEIMKPNAR